MIYSLRLTLDDDDQVKDFLKTYTAVLCVKEDPDTEISSIHYHTLIHTDIKLPTFRARLKTHFGNDFKGNKHYSIKSIDEDENDKAINYLCKGKSKTKEPLIILNTYSIDTNDRHTLYWEIRADIKHQTKTKPKENCIQFILDKYTSPPYTNLHNIEDTIIPHSLQITEAEICDTMLQWYQSQGFPIPHRTTGESIIKQCVYDLPQIEGRTQILHTFYGIRFNL